MNLLKTIIDTDFDNPVLHEKSTYNNRRAARAVLLDNDGSVFLMYVSLHSYHKLPGGGIDEGESIEEALVRELREEVGCECEIISELGEIIEYRDYWKLAQTSYCFVAKKVGDKAINNLEQDELDEGMQEAKASSLGAAIKLLENDRPNNLEGQFIRSRDLCFLKEAEKQLG